MGSCATEKFQLRQPSEIADVRLAHFQSCVFGILAGVEYPRALIIGSACLALSKEARANRGVPVPLIYWDPQNRGYSI